MAQFNFIPYMREIAEKLKVIQHTNDEKHFHRVNSLIDLDEFLANLRTMKGFQLVALDKLNLRLIDNKSDNLLKKSLFTYYLFRNVLPGDFDSEELIKNELQSVNDKILSKLFKDRWDGENGLKFLDRASVYIDSIGPVATGYYGLMVNFSLIEPKSYIYNPDDWN